MQVQITLPARPSDEDIDNTVEKIVHFFDSSTLFDIAVTYPGNFVIDSGVNEFGDIIHVYEKDNMDESPIIVITLDDGNRGQQASGTMLSFFQRMSADSGEYYKRIFAVPFADYSVIVGAITEFYFNMVKGEVKPRQSPVILDDVNPQRISNITIDDGQDRVISMPVYGGYTIEFEVEDGRSYMLAMTDEDDEPMIWPL